ncbi:hypothetical protein [Neisseria perflava]|uniref:hypothetical protein n=1 Tax=Neisseria perflava TaxID=33053 RepID=UPI0020A1C02F|nr:hypothetical protein [Neisseria perflava]MCP1659118.1 putative lipoprotein [Neisseria perflava]MCP1771385.1 putative lipoprotein [Neisseria perflava]
MKKLLIPAALAMLLAACSSTGEGRRHGHDRGPQQKNPAVEKALQECRQTVGDSQDRSKFDACMKEKGFERPAQPPKGPAPQGQAPQSSSTTAQ